MGRVTRFDSLSSGRSIASCLAVLTLVWGCGVRSTPFQIVFESDADRNAAASIVLRISSGDVVVYQDVFPLALNGSTGEQIPRLGPGTYRFLGLGISADCRVIAEGSGEVTLPLPEGQSVQILLRSASRAECRDPLCATLSECGAIFPDAGMDSSADSGSDGSTDASGDVFVPNDALPLDAGCQSPAQCDNGNVCDGIETCLNGLCAAGTPLSCPNDGLGCNGTETCTPGVGCSHVSVPNCDDLMSCTMDSCVEPGVCQNVVNGACPPANDLPANAEVLVGQGDTIGGTLVGATQQGAGCGGVEVYYRWTLNTAAIVMLSNVDLAAIDTLIAYRGVDCNAAVECANDSCGTPQATLLRALPAGTHCFSVSTAGPAAQFRLQYAQMPAASQSNTLITPGISAYGGTLAPGGVITPSCATNVNAGQESAYFFLVCPGGASIRATTCGLGNAPVDTLLSLARPGGTFFCNDNDPGCGVLSTVPTLQINGLSPYALYVDSQGGTGPYTVQISLQ